MILDTSVMNVSIATMMEDVGTTIEGIQDQVYQNEIRPHLFHQFDCVQTIVRLANHAGVLVFVEPCFYPFSDDFVVVHNKDLERKMSRCI